MEPTDLDLRETAAGPSPVKKAWTSPRLTVHGTVPTMTFDTTGPA
jgi:hypothetical protein